MHTEQIGMYCDETNTKTAEEFVSKCAIACKKAEEVIKRANVSDKSNRDFVMKTLRDSGVYGLWFLKIDFDVEAIIKIYIQAHENKPFTKKIMSE
jgi:DNA-binding transcriptional regulator of glucitol operon